MKTSFVVLNILCLVLMSCGDDKSTIIDTDIETKDQKIVITAKAIENFDYTDYALSADADKVIVDWEKYQELAIQINYLKKADLSFFNSEKGVLKTFIGEFRATIPEQIRSNPIVSRTVIIETTLLKLNENLTIDNIDEQDKLLSVKELLESFSNLNYQINKKLERDIYDKIEKE